MNSIDSEIAGNHLLIKNLQTEIHALEDNFKRIESKAIT